jgi:hypothetical protein
MNIAQHLGMHLGKFDQSWSSSSLVGVDVCMFRDQPSVGLLTFATLGLSSTILQLGERRSVRQELLLVARADEASDVFSKLLIHVAALMLHEQRALLRGDIVPLGESIIAERQVDHLYASIPVVFCDELAVLNDSTPPTVLVWLIPLQKKEIDFVRTVGWSEFETRLESTDPDLYDLRRESVV